MIAHDAKLRFHRLQERLGDPLLTVLTILFALLLFVIAPLHAAGIVLSQDVGLAVALRGHRHGPVRLRNLGCRCRDAVGVWRCLAATVLRHRHQTPLDLYLDATAWILLGLALSWVVARAVFAPGRITYHRIMGAILLYLTIGVTFVALYTFVGLLIPDSFSGMSLKDSPTFASTMVYFSFGTLTTAGSADISPLHPIARSLTNVEAMIGQLYPATLLARIVTLEIENEKKL